MPLNFALEQKSKVLSGAGSIADIGQMVTEAGYKKPFVIYDAVIKNAGISDRIIALLKAADLDVVEFGEAQPEPPDVVVEAAAEICKSNDCDCVISIGGGSTTDTAKGVTVLRFNPGRILDYAKPEAQMCHCPGLISVPTTSGTGSELSNGIIISNSETGEKVPIVGYNAMSEYVILDPELTVGMPKSLTAMTGLDVFSHAMEAYTTVLASPIVDTLCEKVMQDVVEYLPKAVEDGSNVKVREKMLTAASLGGWMLANCCAHVGHSLAHVIGAHFHIPHGAACAYTCPASMRFIAPAVPEKIKKIGEILGLKFDGNETLEQITEKTCDAYVNFRDVVVGLKPLKEYGVSKEEALTLAPAVAAECFAPLTPIPVTEEAARRMLEESFAD